MVVGLVSDSIETSITKNDQDLLEQLGGAVGVALDNKLLLEENQRVLRQLQKTNQRLKEMDETKDEFISMASHQLRTPLTSVKGYVSMVLEGDAGKITTQQKELLTQAFTSSQRMVYLIADLLNVSRLKTGKFIIDAKPTNLADVVEGEISQLREQAKSKKMKFVYDKPANFPEILLDETKIRQVIMNFTDNAIYYTPMGGSITIELKCDKSHIYFMVKDNGLGVPKAEQSHLFGKFYRASNAKKARPDGTGLGLFMAKKVVTAQGGSILFESVEGKGSTFGFVFDRKKLAVKQQ
jgi:signal transduction histidine kinase